MRQGVKVVGNAALIAELVLLPRPVIALQSDLPTQLPDRLPRKESAEFALAAERATLEPAYRKRGLGLDFEGVKPNHHFYTWTVVPTWGQGVVYFAVDRRTGDVWAYLGCERVRSRELAALQAKFRRRFNVSAWQVRNIEQEGFPGPDC
jgi:hypothetical protein